MNKVLVTGSAGLVGRQVTKDLVEKNFDVYSCYNKEKPSFGIGIRLDLASDKEIAKTIQTIKPDIVIHLAAITNVDLCEVRKDLAALINTKATEILARESAKQQAFFIYMSTDYVFDGSGLKKETDIPNPLNFYGKSKLDGECILKNFFTSYAIVRTSTPFGVHPKKKSFPVWVKDNLQSKIEIPVLVDQYTSPTFVPNLSSMIIEIAIKKNTGITHLAGATRISRYKFAEMIADKLNLDKTFLKPTKITQMKWNAKRPADSSLDVSKAKETLDNKPQTIETSLELFIRQLKNL